MRIPNLSSSPATPGMASSVESPTAGFVLLGDVSVVDKSTILRFGTRLLLPVEVIFTSLRVVTGDGRSLRMTDGSRGFGYSITGLFTSTAE